jgi:trigger factor
MQVSIETTTGLERRLTIVVPAESVDSEVEKRLKEASRTVRIDGFRPGKVPLKVVKKRYGAGVRQEVLGEVMSRAFYDAVVEKELKPAGQPSVEPKVNEDGKDLEFTATFEIYPEIELADYSTLEVTKLNAEVTDADVDNMIAVLQKQQASWEVAEKAAEQGDQVNLDFEGFKDGEAFEGGAAQGTDLELGSARMIPGFEDGLVGLSAGDEKTLELTFPEEYHSEELKGAAVEFKVTVNSVKAQQLPELNDEFFAKFGVEEGGEAKFREEVRANMERELAQAAKNKVKSQVMDGLLAANKVEIPAALSANEINVLRQQAMQQFGGANANLDPSFLPDELFKEQAERRVALGLLLSEVVKAESLVADKDKVRATIDEFAATYHDPEEVVNYYYQNEQQLASVESLVLEDQVVEKILESAKVTEQDSSYDEVLKPDNAPAGE